MDRQIKKKLILISAITLILVMSVIIFVMPSINITNNSEKFITALVEDNRPEEYCTGEVLYRVMTNDTPKAEVVSIKSTILDSRPQYSRVYIETEIRLPDKTMDIGFYELDLVKLDQWKVFALRETMPKITSINLPKKNLQKIISSTYQEYIKKMDTTMLAGPAKTAFEKQPQLSNTKQIRNLKTKILFNNKLVIASHSYGYDGRKVNVLVHYYRTCDGYKIVSIQAI